MFNRFTVRFAQLWWPIAIIHIFVNNKNKIMSIRILNVNRLQIAFQLLNDLKIIIKIKSK